TQRTRRHEPAENADHRTGEDGRNDPCELRNARCDPEPAAKDSKQNSDDEAGADVRLANRVGTMEIVAIGHQSVEDASADRGEMRVEMVLQFGKLDGIERAVVEERRKHFEFVRTSVA